MPAPASTAFITGPQWSRPPFALIRGVRPNSPTATTSVSSSKPRLLQIIQQRGEGHVELRGEHIFHPIGVASVRVPQRVIDASIAGNARPVDRHEPDARLDQTPTEQHALSPRVAAVAIAQSPAPRAD